MTCATVHFIAGLLRMPESWQAAAFAAASHALVGLSLLGGIPRGDHAIDHQVRSPA